MVINPMQRYMHMYSALFRVPLQIAYYVQVVLAAKWLTKQVQ